jgi:hypothetical protein
MTGTIDKAAALEELYTRIARVARAMGGVPVQATTPIGLPSTTVATPRSVEVPALHVEMPKAFRVEFTPSSPLSAPFVLSVQVRRAQHGLPKSGSILNFVAGNWRMAQTPLSDDEISTLLTLQGPPVF